MGSRVALMVSVLLLLLLTGCSRCTAEPEVGEYRPAIMVNERIYWLCPAGDVNVIPEGCVVIGQIEKVSAPTRPPESNWEAIGFFSRESVGADIYQGEDKDRIYVYNAELERYTPFEAEGD